MRRARGNLEAIFIGTIAVHTALLLALDIGGTWARQHPPVVVEEIELDDTPPPPEIKIPLPKLPDLTPPKPTEPTQPSPQRTPPAHVATHAQPVHEPPPNTPPVPTTTEQPTPGGGDEAYKLPEGPTGGIAIPVAHGHAGGGAGGGAGGSTGGGTGSAPAPVSIAAIKKKAMPRGDYSYFGAGSDYPAEARQLGIEGTIRVRLVVDAHGKVISRTLLNRLGHGLDELAMARAETIEFDPALDEDDHPVTSIVVWTFDFQLPK